MSALIRYLHPGHGNLLVYTQGVPCSVCVIELSKCYAMSILGMHSIACSLHFLRLQGVDNLIPAVLARANFDVVSGVRGWVRNGRMQACLWWPLALS